MCGRAAPRPDSQDKPPVYRLTGGTLHGEASYYTLRPTIAIARPDSTSASRALDLDGFFGLPPAMASLMPAYRAGNLLVIHGYSPTFRGAVV